jgi:hypothetical protein
MRAANVIFVSSFRVIPVSISPADTGWTDAAALAPGLPRPFATVWRFIPQQTPTFP